METSYDVYVLLIIIHICTDQSEVNVTDDKVKGIL